MSSGLLLAALAIISRTCIFYLELEYMVVLAVVFLDLVFFGYKKMLLSLRAIVSVIFLGLFVI